MPGAKDETIDRLEAAISTMKPVSTLIDEGLTPEEMLETILGKDNVTILESMPTEFECNCSHDKF